MNLFTPTEVTSNYASVGAVKTKLSAQRMLLLGILAGFLIGMGGAVANTASHGIGDAGIAKLISGLLFPFGLAMVVLTGAELFTGNTLISISVLDKQTTVANMLKNWLYVYIGNAIGGIVLAASCAFLGQFNCSGGALAVYTMKVAAGKCSLSWLNAVGLGIFCNILVTIAVLLSMSAKDLSGRFLGAYIPVVFFVICGFEHSIANLFYVPAGIFASQIPAYAKMAIQYGIDINALTWNKFLLGNLLPVTIGNIIGGVGVGSLFWYCYRKPQKSKETVDEISLIKALKA